MKKRISGVLMGGVSLFLLTPNVEVVSQIKSQQKGGDFDLKEVTKEKADQKGTSQSFESFSFLPSPPPEEDITKEWKASEQFKVAFTNWKQLNPLLLGVDKFVKGDKSNVPYQKWSLKKDALLEEDYLKSKEYKVSYEQRLKVFATNFKMNSQDDYAKSKWSNDDYNNWRLLKSSSLQKAWEKSTSGADAFIAKNKMWFNNNKKALNTLSKWALSSESDEDFSSWINKLSADELFEAKRKTLWEKTRNFYTSAQKKVFVKDYANYIVSSWKQDGDKFANSFANFVKTWKTNYPHINTKEKFLNHLQEWKATKNYQDSLTNYVNKKIAYASKNILQTLTTDNQYQKWVASKPIDQVDNWVKLSKTNNPNFITYQKDYVANNDQEEYITNNFPKSRYQKWKKSHQNVFNAWKKHYDKDLIFTNWFNNQPAREKNLATSKSLGTHPHKKDFYLQYLDAKLEEYEYSTLKNQKFKDWIENSPHSLIFDFQKTLPESESSLKKYFASSKGHYIWKKWFKASLAKSPLLKQDFTNKWEQGQLKGAFSYADAYNIFTSTKYTTKNFLLKVKTSGSKENNLFKTYHQSKIDSVKANSSFASKDSWLTNMESDERSNLHLEWVKSKPKTLYDKYKKSDAYEQDFKKWEASLKTDYQNIDLWAKNYASKREYFNPRPDLFITKELSPEEIGKFWDLLWNKPQDKNKNFWNLATYVVEKPQEFARTILDVKKETFFYPQTSKIELTTSTYPNLDLGLRPNAWTYSINVLERWINTRIPEMQKRINAANKKAKKANIPDLLPYDNKWNQAKDGVIHDVNTMNVSNISQIVKYLSKPDEPQLALFVEFIDLIKFLYPDITTKYALVDPVKTKKYKDEYSKKCYEDGLCYFQLRPIYWKYETTYTKIGYKVWLDNLKGSAKYNFAWDVVLEMEKSPRFKRNLFMHKIKSPHNANGRSSYLAFKRKKFEEIIANEDVESGDYFAKYLQNNPHLVSEGFARSKLADTKFKRIFAHKVLTSTFGNVEDKYKPTTSEKILQDAFLKYYTTSPTIFNDDLVSITREKLNNDLLKETYFTKYIEDFSNQKVIDKFHSMATHAPDLMKEKYKKFLINKYYQKINLGIAFNHWKTKIHIESDDFINEYNNSSEAKALFLKNAKEEFNQSNALEKSYQEWKKDDTNIKLAYKKSDDARNYYQEVIKNIYYQNFDKTKDFLSQIKSRKIGQKFYELSGAAKKDLRTNLLSSFMGSYDEYNDFLKFVINKKGLTKGGKSTPYPPNDYEDFLSKQYHKSHQFQEDMSYWLKSQPEYSQGFKNFFKKLLFSSQTINNFVYSLSSGTKDFAFLTKTPINQILKEVLLFVDGGAYQYNQLEDDATLKGNDEAKRRYVNQWDKMLNAALINEDIKNDLIAIYQMLISPKNDLIDPQYDAFVKNQYKTLPYLKSYNQGLNSWLTNVNFEKWINNYQEKLKVDAKWGYEAFVNNLKTKTQLEQRQTLNSFGTYLYDEGDNEFLNWATSDDNKHKRLVTKEFVFDQMPHDKTIKFGKKYIGQEIPGNVLMQKYLYERFGTTILQDKISDVNWEEKGAGWLTITDPKLQLKIKDDFKKALQKISTLIYDDFSKYAIYRQEFEIALSYFYPHYKRANYNLSDGYGKWFSKKRVDYKETLYVKRAWINFVVNNIYQIVLDPQYNDQELLDNLKEEDLKNYWSTLPLARQNYTHYMFKTYKEASDGKFYNNDLDKWSQDKNNGLKTYQESVTLSADFNHWTSNFDFWVKNMYLNSESYQQDFTTWSHHKDYGANAYAASGQAHKDYELWLLDQYQTSSTHQFDYLDWKAKIIADNPDHKKLAFYDKEPYELYPDWDYIKTANTCLIDCPDQTRLYLENKLKWHQKHIPYYNDVDFKTYQGKDLFSQEELNQHHDQIKDFSASQKELYTWHLFKNKAAFLKTKDDFSLYLKALKLAKISYGIFFSNKILGEDGNMMTIFKKNQLYDFILKHKVIMDRYRLFFAYTTINQIKLNFKEYEDLVKK